VDKFLTFTVVGLSTAAIYAVIASGLVLTYTTTGVFNFAQGAIGMLAAFTYWQLKVSWHWSTPAALALVLLVLAPLFGVFLEVVVMRGLQGTAEVTKYGMYDKTEDFIHGGTAPANISNPGEYTALRPG